MPLDQRADASALPAKSLDLAGRIKQLTAILAALTTLVAGVTALVVAARSGWNEVGPYFGNLLRHGETAMPKPSPDKTTSVVPIDPALIAALDDETHEGRARARTALSLAIAKASPTSVSQLIDQLETSYVYRTQLGIAAALQHAPGGWRSADPAKDAQRVRSLNSKDPTLRAALDGAANAAQR